MIFAVLFSTRDSSSSSFSVASRLSTDHHGNYVLYSLILYCCSQGNTYFMFAAVVLQRQVMIVLMMTKLCGFVDTGFEI